MRVEAPAICGAIFLSSCFFIWLSLEPVNVKDLPGLLRNSGPDTLNWSKLAKLHGSYSPDTEKCVSMHTAPLAPPASLPLSLSAVTLHPQPCHSTTSQSCPPLPALLTSPSPDLARREKLVQLRSSHLSHEI